jgi:hypothetical protein
MFVSAQWRTGVGLNELSSKCSWVYLVTGVTGLVLVNKEQFCTQVNASQLALHSLAAVMP